MHVIIVSSPEMNCRLRPGLFNRRLRGLGGAIIGQIQPIREELSNGCSATIGEITCLGYLHKINFDVMVFDDCVVC